MRSLLRTIASLAMLASLALPLYTCHGYVAPDGHAVSGVPTGADSAAYRPTRIPHYPLEAPSPSELSFWVGLLAYAWPMLLLVIARSGRVRRHPLTTAVIQALLAIASGYVILFAMMWGDWAIGAYVVLCALIVLLSDGLLGIGAEVRARRRRASSTAANVAPTGG